MPVKSDVILALEQVFHFRLRNRGGLLSRGGVTVCYIPSQGKARLAATVCSLKDNYCKKTGRLVAKGRGKGPDIVQGTFDQVKTAAEEIANSNWNRICERHPAPADTELVLV